MPFHTDPVSPVSPGYRNGFTADDVTHYESKFKAPPVYHRGDGVGIKEAIGGIMPPNPATFEQKQELLIQLRHLYTNDPRYKRLNLWPATRDWLRKEILDPDIKALVLD